IVLRNCDSFLLVTFTVIPPPPTPGIAMGAACTRTSAAKNMTTAQARIGRKFIARSTPLSLPDPGNRDRMFAGVSHRIFLLNENRGWRPPPRRGSRGGGPPPPGGRTKEPVTPTAKRPTLRRRRRR